MLCYGAMMSLAIGLNLLPVFLTTISRTYGGAGGLTHSLIPKSTGSLRQALWMWLAGFFAESA